MSEQAWYQDQSMLIAQDMHRQSRHGAPSEHDVNVTAGRETHRAVTGAQRGPRKVQTTRVSRQARQALTGRPVQPLPTRTARRAKARQRKMIRRLGVATPIGMAVMIALLFMIPVLAAVTMGLSVTALILAQSR